MVARLNRRQLLAGAAAGAAAWALPGPRAARAADPPEEWNPGELAHLIPAASHERVRIKASFRSALRAPPRLRVGDREVAGTRTDTRGRFWAFELGGLKPATRYSLALRDSGGRALCDSWPLATFPAPDATRERFRLLVYTCAGGDEAFASPDGTPAFVPLSERRRLLRRGLSFSPDAVLAIGDHTYLDQQSGILRLLRLQGEARIRELAQQLGVEPVMFNRAEPVLGGPNEELLVDAVDPQLARLYGTLLRSVPSFFSQDDHDYFEDDRTSEEYVTFPPDPFMLRLARAVQHLYYPEFFADPHQPPGLAGIGAPDRTPSTSECYGAVRFGRLAELLVYDCRRHLTLKGPSAGFVPRETEAWLRERMRTSDASHVVNVPSTPIAWSAGKWLEWYPDLLQPGGGLGTRTPKPYWQTGWFAQHNRLLEAASRRGGVPLFVSGDLHSLGVGRVVRSRELDLRANPVVSLLSGPIGTGPPGWPSNPGNRGTRGTPPEWLEVQEELPCVERNGFTLIDFAPQGIRVRMFSWRLGDPPAAIDALEPFHEFERASRA